MLRVAVCDDDLTYINSVLKPLISKALRAAELQAETHFFIQGNVLLNEFKNHNGYDIVILDIDIPDINGKDIAKYIRACLVSGEVPDLPGFSCRTTAIFRRRTVCTSRKIA